MKRKGDTTKKQKLEKLFFPFDNLINQSINFISDTRMVKHAYII
jgi:hypothetical protein